MTIQAYFDVPENILKTLFVLITIIPNHVICSATDKSDSLQPLRARGTFPPSIDTPPNEKNEQHNISCQINIKLK